MGLIQRITHFKPILVTYNCTRMPEDCNPLECKLYRLLLEKYAGLINDHEKKTIGQLKALVDPENLSIQSLLADFLPQPYAFETHYLEVAEKAYTFICNEITYVKTNMGLNYWLSPEEILTHKIADDEDIAILLCSILHALGDKNARVIIAELSDVTTHAFVLTEHSDKTLLLDPTQHHAFTHYFGEKTEILQKYSFNSAPIRQFLYQFNYYDYQQFLNENE